MNLRPADAAHPLRFWRADQLHAMEHVLGRCLRAWAGDWGLAEDLVCADCRRMTARDGEAASQGIALRGANGAAAWFHAQAWMDALPELLLGAAIGSSGIAVEVVRACIDDARLRLAQALDLAPARSDGVPPLRRRDSWSGEVGVLLPFGGSLLLNAEAVEACLRHGGSVPPSPCTPRPAGASVAMPLLLAASEQRLPVHAQLASCEVDLGVLQDLQPGDVLRIPHRLDAPLQVRAESGATLFNGYLASSRGRKVLELAAAA